MRLRAEQLAAHRGGQTVFSELSFALEPGQATLVTGPNGAGKTTLLRVLAGLLPASGGAFRFEPLANGEPPPIHYLGHHNALKSALTARENLDFWQRFAGAKAASCASKAACRSAVARRSFSVASSSLARPPARKLPVVNSRCTRMAAPMAKRRLRSTA